MEHETFIKHPDVYGQVEALLGKGLVTSTGELWARQRKLLSPLFHLRKLRSYVPLINDEARRLCERLESDGASGSSALQCVPMFGDAAQRIVMRAMFGERVDLDEQTELWGRITDGLFVFFGASMVLPIWLLTRVPFGVLGAYNRALAHFAQSTRKTIAAIRAAPDAAANSDLISQMALMRDENGQHSIDGKSRVVVTCRHEPNHL